MSMYLDPLDDDVSKAIGAVTTEPPLRLKDLHPENPDVKTYGIAPRIIADTDVPAGSIGRLPEITLPPSRSSKVAEAAHAAGIADLAPANKGYSQNLAFEAVKAGLARERFGSDKLHRHSSEIKQHLKNIDDLLDLSAELTALGEKDSHDISPKMQGLIDQLKGNGIDVWPNGANKISKDKLGEMKSLVSSHIDKSRTKLQTTITVDIQPEINNLNSIMNVIQQMIQSDARLKKHANDNSTK